MTLPTVIALDIGHSAVKCLAMSQGQREKILFPSVVTPARSISEDSAARDAQRETIEVAGKSYFFGTTAVEQGGAEAETGMSEGWISTSTHMALFLGALKKLSAKTPAISTDTAVVVVGLPAKYYLRQRQQLFNLLAPHVPGAELIVVPQPLGPFFALQFDEEGRETRSRNLRAESWAIIEVGHFTTDFALIKGGRWIERGSDSCDGAFRAVETLAKKLSDRTGESITQLEAAEALVTRTLRMYRENLDVREEIEFARHAFADEVMPFAERLFDREARGLDGIIVAGGGADLIKDRVATRFKNVVESPHSRFSVAEGFLRAGLIAARDSTIRKARALPAEVEA